MLTFSKVYDHKYLLQCLLQLVVLIALMKVTGGVAFLLVAALVFYGLFTNNNEFLFFWLLVSVCMLIGNGYIVSRGAVFAWTQRILMVVLGFFMTIRVFGYKRHKALSPMVGMIFYIVYMCVPSAVGWCPVISYLKLILFTFIYFAYFGIANQCGINPHVSSRRIRCVMLVVAIFFIFGSMALIPFPGVSQMRAQQILEMGGSLEDLKNTTSLFAGMANHSQCLGPVVSTTAVVLLGDLLFSVKKFDCLYAGLLICCPLLIYKTSSRTGMGAFVLGVLFVVYLFLNSRGMNTRWKGVVRSYVMMGLVVVFALGAFLPSVQRGVRRYLIKFGDRDSQEMTVESLTSTRMGKIMESWENFKESPLLGNGFQVSREMKGLKLSGGSSILSAPIEKGVWITAVLEEGGFLGWSIFVIFLVSCILTSIRNRAYLGASCLFVLTLTNLGEFTFFSMSYAGGFAWAMVFVGYALDTRRMVDEQKDQQARMANLGAIPAWAMTSVIR